MPVNGPQLPWGLWRAARQELLLRPSILPVPLAGRPSRLCDLDMPVPPPPLAIVPALPPGASATRTLPGREAARSHRTLLPMVIDNITSIHYTCRPWRRRHHVAEHGVRRRGTPGGA